MVYQGNINLLMASILARFIMAGVYGYIFLYFYNGYRKMKRKGFNNPYFLAFSILFGILIITNMIYSTYNFYYNLSENPIDLKGQFPWYTPQGNIVDKIAYQIRPLYLIFYFIVNAILAIQVYTLEKAMARKRVIWSKIIFIFGATELLLFIPPLSYSYFTFVPIILGFLGIILGFFLNIIANIILAIKSTGAIRKQAIYALFAFLLLGFGMYWSLEVGISKMINPTFTYNHDVIFGSILQFFAVVLYRLGFPTPTYKEITTASVTKAAKLGEDKSKEGEEMSAGPGPKGEGPNKRVKELREDEIKGPLEDSNVFSFIIGRFSRNGFLEYICITIILFVIYVSIARALYPPENAYSIFKDTISFLGSSDADNNPNGWMFLTMALYSMGILFIPIIFRRYRKLKQLANVGAIFPTIFYLIAAIGMILVGTFPDNGGMSFVQDLSAGRLHNIVSLFAFGGFGLGVFFEFLILIKDQIPKLFGHKILDAKYWLGFFLGFFIIIGVGAYFLIKWSIICEHNCWPGVGIYSFPFWEWTAMISLYILFFGTLIIYEFKINSD
ncbi:MAG: hypothetical protein ACTSU2_17485 [Promethearchaeota archaeon]